MAQDRAAPPPAKLKVLAARDFVAIGQMQATLWTPEAEVSGAKLLMQLVPRWQSRFDSEPVVLPTASGLPRDLPRLILQQQRGEWRCEVSAERINVYWQKTKPDSTQPTKFALEAAELFDEYIRFLGARVGRMAAVLTRYAPHPSPALFLARHFCDARWAKAPFNRPENFELHAHKTFTLAKRFSVNSWVRNKTGFAATEGGQVGVVLVEQDLNTLFEEIGERSFTPSDVREFFSAAHAEFDSILNLYYPSEEGVG